jgi:uncharacterized protein YjeT (DUF2065 family)
MLTIVLIIGIFFLLVGIAILLQPEALRKLLQHFLKMEWLIPATLIRVVTGIIFLLAAPGSRYPLLLQILGVIFVLAGVTIPLLGKLKIEALAAWWLARPDTMLRILGGAAALLGAVIIWVSI